MTILEARQYLADNTPQIHRDFHGRVVPRIMWSLLLAAKWGDDRDVIAAVERYMAYRNQDSTVIKPDAPDEPEREAVQR